MRRDDAKKLIAALIRRRHNDALRIKKLRSRLSDGDDGRLSLLLNERNKLAQQLYKATGINPKSKFFTTEVARKIELEPSLRSLYRVLDRYENIDSKITNIIEFGN